MKLSEAIRKGIKVRPEQTFEKYFDERIEASCGMGAALEGFSGIKRDSEEDIYKYLERPEVLLLREALRSKLRRWVCPEKCGESKVPLDICPGFLIIHLNDDHFWTREQIADYAEKEMDTKIGDL